MLRRSDPIPEPWDWAVIRMRCVAEARRMLRRHHDAEEVAQEAMARAWRSRASCRTPDAPIAWCLQITRNEALRLIARSGRAGAIDTLDSAPELEDDRSGNDYARTVERLDVARALEQLSEHERLMIALRYQDGWSHTQIAEKLRIGEATARVHLHRAQKRLKPLLEAHAASQ